ncbi:MAG: efflux RND transporter permease subunit [Planctomycetes bacterium]|nr:efflux RND transporter permease subunit [Planctomycetota bacterium]
MLRPRHVRSDLLTRFLDFALGWLFRLFNRALESSTKAYAGAIRRVLRVAALFLLVYAGLVVLAYFGFRTVPTGFIPPQDKGNTFVALQMPDASTIDRTQATMRKLSEIARKIPGVQEAFAVSGFSILNRVNQTSGGTMFLQFAPFDERSPSRSVRNGHLAEARRRICQDSGRIRPRPAAAAGEWSR